MNELDLNMKDYSQNCIINKYFEQKEIKCKHDGQVRFVEVGNTNNLSGYMLIKNNQESVSASKKMKQSKSHYVEVVFAGLRQPSKKIDMRTYEVLICFIRRFKIWYVDICFDGEHKNLIDNKMYYSQVFTGYIGRYSKVNLVDTTFYINNPSAPNENADYFRKMIVYDKYIKESRYKSLGDALKYWKRMEFRVRLDAKLKDTNGLEEYLIDMINVAKKYFDVEGISDVYFKQQVLWLTDKRTQRGRTP